MDKLNEDKIKEGVLENLLANFIHSHCEASVYDHFGHEGSLTFSREDLGSFEIQINKMTIKGRINLSLEPEQPDPDYA